MWFGNIKDRILFEDKDILVCQKPAGIAVQSAGIGSMDLESMLKNYLAEKAPGSVPYLAVVHRLDQPVEGILVFAKNQKAAAQLNRQMTSGKIKKEYLAVTDRKPLKRQRADYGLSEKRRQNEYIFGRAERYRRSERGKTFVCRAGDRDAYFLNTSGHRAASSDKGTDGTCQNAAAGRQKVRGFGFS